MISVRLSDLIPENFHELYKQLKSEEVEEAWLKGGRGSIKSTVISEFISLGMQRDKEANAVIFRRYENELRLTVYEQMIWSIEKLEMGSVYNYNVSPMVLTNKQTGQKIIFVGSDNPKKLKSIKLRMGYIKYVWFEECDQYAGYEDIRNIIQSLFRGGNHKRTAFFSFNPPKSGRSWVNTEVKNKKKGRIVHHSTYLDLPEKLRLEWLGERFISEAEHLKKTNETAYRHEYLGEEVGTGVEIFNNIKIREIKDDEIALFDNIRQGLDFGYAVDPLCFLRMHFDRKHRTLYIFSEISGIGLSNRAFVEKTNDAERRELTLADKAEPKSIDEIRDHGMNIKGAEKKPGSVEFGINWLKDLEQIVIDPERCPLAAKEFVNYSLDIARDGTIISRYPDRDNHSIDTTRYALCYDMVDMRKGVKPSRISASSLGL